MGSGRALLGRQLRQLAVNSTAVISTGEHIPTWVVITVASAVGLVAGLLLVVLVCVIIRERNGRSIAQVGANSGSGDPSKELLAAKKSANGPKKADGWPFCMQPSGRIVHTVEGKMREFSMVEVRRATDDFSEDGLLGEGRYGGVFKGTLDNGMHVAVKRMRVEHVAGEITKFGNRAEKEFLSEAKVIVRVHHRHLLPVIGHCSTRDERILILMYMEKGTLEARLQDRAEVLDWNSRLRIAIGAAKGVAYLHEDCFPEIVHRDVKSSNILLDKSNEPRMADFGFARSKELGSRDQRRGFSSGGVHTQVVGTPGYLPLECILWGKNNSVKTDVYSFGVVLLELLTGRPAVIVSEDGKTETLAFVARECSDKGGSFEDMIDPALTGNFDSQEALRLWNVAMQCLSDEPNRRPRMGHVVLMLQGKQLACPPSPRSRRLTGFERAPPGKASLLSFKVDLWARTADSPLTRAVVPGRASPQSPHSAATGSKYRAGLSSPAEGSRTNGDEGSSDSNGQIRKESHSRAVSDHSKLSTSKDDSSLRESVGSQALESHLLQAEDGPSSQGSESAVWKDSVALPNLRTVPDYPQATRFCRPQSPGADTCKEESNGQANAASPVFGERDGKIVSLEASQQVEDFRSRSERYGQTTPDRKREGVLSFITKAGGRMRKVSSDTEISTLKNNPLFGVERPPNSFRFEETNAHPQVGADRRVEIPGGINTSSTNTELQSPSLARFQKTF